MTARQLTLAIEPPPVSRRVRGWRQYKGRARMLAWMREMKEQLAGELEKTCNAKF